MAKGAKIKNIPINGGYSSSKAVVPTQTVRGSKPFGTYNFPKRGK